MLVTHELIYDYLWVDRFYIFKDHRTSKYVLSQLMQKIYESTQFTLVAAVGDGAAHCLSGVSGAS